MQRTIRLPWIALLLVAVSGRLHGMDPPYPGPFIENEDLLVVLRPQLPDSMAAFYEARGFPREAIDLVRSTCFVTVHIENKSDDTLWLDVSEWSFTANGRPVERLGRDDWDRQWDRINLRQASRSTFGWTQLPEVRNLQPDEPVGGNLVFPGDTRTLDLVLNLPTGEDRRGRLITLHFDHIECRREAPPQ